MEFDPQPSPERTCALVVIGNEILSGKVRDSNAYFAVRELREIGVALKRIVVIGDELDAIAEEVAESARRFDFVITSGGVGPTHDDLTIAGVGRAFGLPIVRHPELERIIRERFGPRITDASLKMADVPQGAVLIPDENIIFPTVQVRNVYILPGIPQLFEAKLSALKQRFSTAPYFGRVVYVNAGETQIAEHLNACLAEFPALMLGSYPAFGPVGNPQYRVKLTLESKDRSYLERALDRLLELIPSEVVVKVE